MTAALVPGSFDPPTNGHLDVIGRCAGIFDSVLVAVVDNPAKSPLLSADERVEVLAECCVEWGNVRIGSFSGLLVDYARDQAIDVIVKGLRAITDFDYELQMAQMNRHLSDFVTMFVVTKPEYGYLSSSLVKQVAKLGGSVESLVPEPAMRRLEKHLGEPDPA